ncbi:unnamed protein product [Paramecium octaurelia]|uniref:SEC7 domain-containing protein n=1 Tax=Paramecium octaurelia TaxID=43137 RepID=A0A8S1WLR8_PAROT|nr:unnamed protein product [Paramecium octaurelia]
MNTKGLNKDIKRTKRFLRLIVNFMNLKVKSYLDAMRLLLSRIRIAGEAQIVVRVVKIFARVYNQQNSDEFKQDETSYVLAYTFIMLSTDTASTKILEKNRMIKEQFKKNSIAFPNILPNYFEEVYDSVTREPFRTTSVIQNRSTVI